MNIHEYQAKEILAKSGIPVMRGKVAHSPEEAVQIAEDLKGNLWVVKAQIHAGGRGKAGGIILCHSPGEVREAARKLLGQRLATSQTGSPGISSGGLNGHLVKCVYIEEGCAIERELYISLVVDRLHQCLAFIASKAGGMDIEETAARQPDHIITVRVDPASGFQPYHGRQLAYGLGLKGEAATQMGRLSGNLYALFKTLDASLVEINPLVITKTGDLKALDAKMSFDESGLLRHPEIGQLRDEDEEDASEREAARQGLSYVKLDGTIGCMVNGAGLAMATMDIIKLHGAQPANFLDIGGGATQERVAVAFKLISADKNVKAILINIFGGIMRCDVVAEGILAAAREVGLTVPMVVRLQGTHENQGRQILASSSLKIMLADDLGDAALKVVQAVREAA